MNALVIFASLCVILYLAVRGIESALNFGKNRRRINKGLGSAQDAERGKMRYKHLIDCRQPR